MSNPTFRDLRSMLAAEPKLWVKIEPEGAFYWAELWRDEEKLHCAKARDPETALAKLITYAEGIWCRDDG